MTYRWAILWRSKNKLDGSREFIKWKNGFPLLFKTRTEARKYIDEHYGYIRDRVELREEPFGWKIPKAVKVNIIIERV